MHGIVLGVSLVLCLADLLLARSHPWAWAPVIALGLAAGVLAARLAAQVTRGAGSGA